MPERLHVYRPYALAGIDDDRSVGSLLKEGQPAAGDVTERQGLVIHSR
jgi:hypothetical protein